MCAIPFPAFAAFMHQQAECSCSPQLHPLASTQTQLDHDCTRLLTLFLPLQAKEQAKRLEEKREKALVEGCTFSPQVNPKSAKLARPGTAASRLYNPEWVAKRKSGAFKYVAFTRTSTHHCCHPSSTTPPFT